MKSICNDIKGEILDDVVWSPATLLLAFSTTLIICNYLVPLAGRISNSFGVIDLPDMSSSQAAIGRRVHINPTPRLGGLAIVISFLASFYFWQDIPGAWFLLVASLVVFAVGIADDFYSISPIYRLLSQITITAVVVWHQGLAVSEITLWHGTSFALGTWLGFALAVLIIVGAINSINMIDGLDGLAGGIVLICIVMLCYISLLLHGFSPLVPSLAVPVIGAILGFLRHNSHPAKIFMGDGGSNWLGFVVGCLMLITLKQSYEAESAIPLISVIMTASMPIVDTFVVITTRLLSRRKITLPDKSHFHHFLLKCGLSHSEAVFTIYFFALSLAVIGISPISFPNHSLHFFPYIFFFGSICLMFLATRMREAPIRQHVTSHAQNSQSRATENTIDSWLYAHKSLIYFLILLPPFFTGVVNRYLGMVCGMGAVIVFVSFFVKSTRNADFLSSLLLSVGAGVLLIANNQDQMMFSLSGEIFNFQKTYNVLYVLLLLSSVFIMFATFHEKYLLVHPSDFLLLTLPLVLLLAPEPFLSEYRLSSISVRILIFFVSLRSLARIEERDPLPIKICILFGLIFIFMTSVLEFRLVHI